MSAYDPAKPDYHYSWNILAAAQELALLDHERTGVTLSKDKKAERKNSLWSVLPAKVRDTYLERAECTIMAFLNHVVSVQAHQVPFLHEDWKSDSMNGMFPLFRTKSKPSFFRRIYLLLKLHIFRFWAVL